MERFWSLIHTLNTKIIESFIEQGLSNAIPGTWNLLVESMIFNQNDSKTMSGSMSWIHTIIVCDICSPLHYGGVMIVESTNEAVPHYFMQAPAETSTEHLSVTKLCR